MPDAPVKLGHVEEAAFITRKEVPFGDGEEGSEEIGVSLVF